MKDVFDIATGDFSVLLDCHKRVCIAKAMFVSESKRTLPAKDKLEFCTLLHIFLWVHREQIFYLIRLVDCCRPFIPVLLNVTDDVFRSSEDAVLLKGNETGECVGDKFMETEVNVTNKIDRVQHETVLSPLAESNMGESNRKEIKLTNVALEFETVSTDVSDNEEEFIDEEVEQREDSKRFEDYLVTIYCEQMFPSKEIVDKNGGLESWMRNASLLLSLGFKIIYKFIFLVYFKENWYGS